MIPNPLGPVLVFGSNLSIGGTGGTAGTGGGGAAAAAVVELAAVVVELAAAVVAPAVAVRRPSTPMSRHRGGRLHALSTTGSWARSTAALTTDFAAPAIDVPTFRRTFSIATQTTTTNTIAGDPLNHLTFTQVGTSMSAAVVTGAYSMVASALDYWMGISHAKGVTSSAYLTGPVGVNSLNFGKHAIKDLSAYNNPDGINGILAYTAVPAADINELDSLSTPPLIALRTASTASRDTAAVLRPGLDRQRHRLDRRHDRDQLPAQSPRLPAHRHQQ